MPVVAALFALLFSSVAPAAHAPRVSSEFAGINAGYVISSVPHSKWPLIFSAMAADGIGVVRSDAPWGLAEPTPPQGGVHTYKLSGADEVVAALARAGLRWQPVLDYSASWDASVSGNIFSAPLTPSYFGAF